MSTSVRTFAAAAVGGGLVSASLIARWGPWRAARLGIGVEAAGMLLLLPVHRHAELGLLAAGCSLDSFGVVLVIVAITSFVMARAPRERHGVIGGAVNAAVSIGGAVGVAVLGAAPGAAGSRAFTNPRGNTTLDWSWLAATLAGVSLLALAAVASWGRDTDGNRAARPREPGELPGLTDVEPSGTVAEAPLPAGDVIES